jgi:ribose transport system permease protein
MLAHRSGWKPLKWVRAQTAQGAWVLAALVLFAAVASPVAADGSRIFLEPGNLTDILRQSALIGILSLGMTFVILTGGIDLSVGSVLALSTAVTAATLTHGFAATWPGAHMVLAIGGGVTAAALVGVLNGVVVARFKVQPFVATLATMIGARGFAKWFTGNENVDIGFGTDVASRFASTFHDKSLVIGIYVVLAGLFWLLLSKTVFGRYVRAVGDNSVAAIYAGLPIARIQVAVYTLSGLLAGMAGVLYAAENHQGNPNAGVAYELDAIAAVVIGGTRLSGGAGSIGGTVIGTLIMGVLTNVLRLNNVDSNVEMMIKAVIIILAVALRRGRKA